jgi:PAS domain-containing protein
LRSTGQLVLPVDRQARLTYKSVIVAMTEGIVVHDAEAAILTCNAAAEEILGLTRDQMSGRSSLDPRWRAIHDNVVRPGRCSVVVPLLRSSRGLESPGKPDRFKCTGP